MNQATMEKRSRQEEVLIEQQERDTDAEVAVFELIERKKSGFVLEGTENLPEDQRDELDAPGFRQILARSAYRVKRKGQQHGRGQKVTGFDRVPIRYRSDSTSIDPAEQDEQGSLENNENDRIVFKKARLIVVNEGPGEGMLKFCRKDSRNETNPDGFPNVPKIYREIFPEKENDLGNVEEFAIAAAISFIEGLIIDRTPGKFQYEENRLSALSQFFRVVAETSGGKIKGLIAVAKIDPVTFLREAKEFEEMAMTDIAHAIHLGIIRFEETRVILVSKGIPIHTFSNKLKEEDKYRSLAAFFHSPQGLNKYTEFTIELKNAKNRNIDSGAQGNQNL